jgi:hypothetical protein
MRVWIALGTDPPGDQVCLESGWILGAHAPQTPTKLQMHLCPSAGQQEVLNTRFHILTMCRGIKIAPGSLLMSECPGITEPWGVRSTRLFQDPFVRCTKVIDEQVYKTRFMVPLYAFVRTCLLLYKFITSLLLCFGKRKKGITSTCHMYFLYLHK